MSDNAKKQIPLRLSQPLYDALAAWAEDDFRSVNGKYVSEHLDEAPEFNVK
ncbi:MAG: PTS ascorbate transporter subunit IIC [Oscillospiraceae bacterium]